MKQRDLKNLISSAGIVQNELRHMTYIKRTEMRMEGNYNRGITGIQITIYTTSPEKVDTLKQKIKSSLLGAIPSSYNTKILIVETKQTIPSSVFKLVYRFLPLDLYEADPGLYGG